MTNLTKQLKEVAELLRVKHQQGRHDQSAHTPKKYGAGGAGGGKSYEKFDQKKFDALRADVAAGKFPTAEATDEFADRALEASGIEGHPDQQKIMNDAWNYGSDYSGHRSVLDYLDAYTSAEERVDDARAEGQTLDIDEVTRTYLAS